MDVDGALAVALTLALSLTVLLVVGSRTAHALPMVVSYLLHGALSAFIYSTLGLYAPDARGYDRKALELVAFWNGESQFGPALSLGKEGYTLMLASAYDTLGYHVGIGLIVNVTAVALLVPVLASTAERLGAPARKAAWLVALFPPIAFWGGLLLREALVWLTLSLAMRGFVGLVKQINRRDMIVTLVALALLLSLRGTAAIIVCAAGLLALVLARRQASTFVTAVLLVSLTLVGPVSGRLESITGQYDVESVNRSRTALTELADSGFATVSYDSPTAMLLALPQVLPRTILGPFPWEWPGLNPLFVADAVVWLLLLFWAYRGWKRLDKRFAFVVIAPAIVITLALGITSGNYGTLQRLRLLSAVMLVPVAAAGIARTRESPGARPTGDERQLPPGRLAHW